MPQTTQFDTSINLLCLVHLMLELCFQYFSYNLHNMFPLFLYEAKSDNVTQLNSIYYDQLIRRFFDVAKYFLDSFKNIQVSFVRINSNKFLGNISLAVSIVIDFLCKFMVMKI